MVVSAVSTEPVSCIVGPCLQGRTGKIQNFGARGGTLGCPNPLISGFSWAEFPVTKNRESKSRNREPEPICREFGEGCREHCAGEQRIRQEIAVDPRTDMLQAGVAVTAAHWRSTVARRMSSFQARRCPLGIQRVSALEIRQRDHEPSFCSLPASGCGTGAVESEQLGGKSGRMWDRCHLKRNELQFFRDESGTPDGSSGTEIDAIGTVSTCSGTNTVQSDRDSPSRAGQHRAGAVGRISSPADTRTETDPGSDPVVHRAGLRCDPDRTPQSRRKFSTDCAASSLRSRCRSCPSISSLLLGRTTRDSVTDLEG